MQCIPPKAVSNPFSSVKYPASDYPLKALRYQGGRRAISKKVNQK